MVLEIIRIKPEISKYKHIINTFYHRYCEYIYNNYIDIASPLRCTYSNEGFTEIIICL